MNRVLLASAVSMMTAALLLPAGREEALPYFWQGYYVGAADLSGGIRQEVEADIFPAYEGQAMFIDFRVSRNPPDRVLGAVSPATNVTSKRFTFSFTDSSGNRGRGTFTRERERFLLRLEPVKRNSGQAASPGFYGDYELLKKEPKGRSDRHPWSLDKAKPKKPAKSETKGPRG